MQWVELSNWKYVDGNLILFINLNFVFVVVALVFAVAVGDSGVDVGTLQLMLLLSF